MENRSTHYGDVSKWIEKVVESCQTREQTFTAKRLIRNFEHQLMKVTPDKYWNTYHYEVIWPLEDKLNRKREILLNNSEN
jgi:hypothetical protein